MHSMQYVAMPSAHGSGLLVCNEVFDASPVRSCKTTDIVCGNLVDVLKQRDERDAASLIGRKRSVCAAQQAEDAAAAAWSDDDEHTASKKRQRRAQRLIQLQRAGRLSAALVNGDVALRVTYEWSDPFATVPDAPAGSAACTAVGVLPEHVRRVGFLMVQLLRAQGDWHRRAASFMKRAHDQHRWHEHYDRPKQSNVFHGNQNHYVMDIGSPSSSGPLYLDDGRVVPLSPRTKYRRRLLYNWRAALNTAQTLADECVDLYVAQAMDWALAVRFVPAGAAQPANNAAFCNRRFTAVAFAALSLVLKISHTDTDVYADFSPDDLALAAKCTPGDIGVLERHLLRAVDYSAYRFADVFTLLQRRPERVAVFNGSRADFDEAVREPDFLPRFARRAREMIVDRVDCFARYSPWVRANAAAASAVVRAPSDTQTMRASPSRAEAHALKLLCAQMQLQA